MTTLVPKYDQGATGAVNRPFTAKLQESVSVIDFGADPTGVADSYAAITAALASFANYPSVYFPAGTYSISAPIAITQLGTRIYGAGRLSTTISQISADWTGQTLVTHPATISVNGQQCTIENMQIYGGLGTNSSDCIIVGNEATNRGQLLSLNRINLSHGAAGVNFISGNLQRWSDVFAQSCDYGFKVTPDAGDNTNGCIMTAIGAYGCGVGLYITQGSGAVGHTASNWDMFVEGGNNGVYIRGGEYCRYDLYVDALSTYAGQYWYDLSPSNPHSYFLKNINNAPNGALGVGSSAALGINGSGFQLSVTSGDAPSQLVSYSSSVSLTLQGQNVNLFDVKNLNTGAQIGMNLSFLAYRSVGTTVTIIKTDTTGAGLILVPPAGVTLIGDTGVFGSFASGVLQVTVLAGNIAYCSRIS